ncbi:MAG: FtsX-like permease family protein [Candidatus Dormibacteria bacterium]
MRTTVPLLLSLAWRNSASRLQRSILTAVAVALGVGLILGTELSARALQRELRQSASNLAGNADAEVFAFSETGFGPEMVKVVSGLPEVGTVAPVVSKRVFGQAAGSSYTFQLLGVDPVAEQKLHPLNVASGSIFGAGEKGTVLLDEKWARAHNVGVGADVSLFTATGPDNFKVKGLLGDSSFVQSTFGPIALVPLSAAQKTFKLGARVTQISVGLTGSYPDFRRDLRLKATEEYTVRDNRAFFAANRNPYEEIQPVLVFFSVLALVIGLFLIYNNLAMSVLERRREIGLLRSAGATPGWVRSLFMTQALILGVAGSALGTVVGVGVAAALVQYLRSTSGQPGLSLVLDAVVILQVAALGLLATVVCAVVPAARASRVAPLEAIRPQQLFTVERNRRRTTALGVSVLVLAAVLIASGLASRPADPRLPASELAVVATGIVLLFGGLIAITPVLLAPLTRVLASPLRALAPAETLLARNALLRRPVRSALTVGGLLVSGALVVAVSGLSQGALDAGSSWVGSLFVSDQLLVSPVRQPDVVREDINKVKGIDATSPIAFFTLRAGSRALNLAAVDPLDYASHGRLEFAPGTPAGAYTQMEESRSILVSRRLAQLDGLHPGDAVPLTAANGILTYHVAAVVEHSLPAPGGEETAMISLANARQDFGVTGFNILQVIPSPGAGAAFAADLDRTASRYGLQPEPVSSVQAGVRRGLDALLVLLTAVGLVGVVMGLVSVVQTILLNISESSREMALLRAVGATTDQVRGIILAQSGLLSLTGAIGGAAVGALLVAVMTRAGASLGFQPVYEVPWSVIGLVIVASVVGALLAVALPARRASRTSVVAAIRYE